MTDANQSLPIAGWYPDPENDRGDRWWNGATWSDHRRSRDAVPPVPVSPVPVSAAPTASAGPAASVPPVVPAFTQPYQQPYAQQPQPYAQQPYGQQPQPYPQQQPYAAAYPQPYAPGYAQPYQQPYTPYAAPGSGVRNVPALVGFIVSIGGFVIGLAFIAGFAGGIVSIIGFQKSRLLAAQGMTTGNGRGLALAGIIIGFLTAIGTIIFWAAIFSAASQSPY